MPKFDITKTPFFEKRVRELKKRFRNIEEELDGWSERLNDIKELGVQLKSNVYTYLGTRYHFVRYHFVRS